MKTNQNLSAGQYMIRTVFSDSVSKLIFPLAFLLVFVLTSFITNAQLGIYEFTGTGACPHQNLSVTAQPANAQFSQFSTVNATCNAATDQNDNNEWNVNSTIDLTEYHEFTITADANYALTLQNLSFRHSVSENGNGSGLGNTAWVLRSSIDNYATDVATGSANDIAQTPSVLLPADFTGITTVTFRLYITEIKDNQTYWTIYDVTVDGSVDPAPALPADPPNPTSDSPQCSNPGVTLKADGTPPAGETWYWQTTATGTSTANSGSDYVVTTSGTYYIRSQDNTTLLWSNGAGSITVTITPDVTAPVFTMGATSTRCEGAGTVMYDATATNTTGITYSLDAASIAGGNSINASTGDVTFTAAWSGTSIITATAAGCNGPQTATHTVTITPSVGTPVFTMGASSTRCQGAATITYSATATNVTGITYSLDAASIAGGNSINPSTGDVTFTAGWSGTSTITASAAGCNGPRTANHTVTITASVSTPTFTLGATSTRCQGNGNVNYTAIASNTTGITYSLDAASLAGGNTINSSNGMVNYSAGWTGTTIITASAAGCNGPQTATHTVTITPSVTTPVFVMGVSSTHCQGATTITYSATATNTTGITYSLDAASIAGGNSINASTGDVTFTAAWSGTSIITATAAGCNGPRTATHTVTITPSVGTPVFTMGATSARCEGANTVTYTATATNNTGITYDLDALSIAGGNTINSSTGAVTYAAGWTGTTTITANATGCNGPQTSMHTVTTTPSVGTPVFTIGATSTRCQGAGVVVYSATANNTTGITYSLNAAAITGGNSINASTGAVTYAAGWTGATIITASAAGCNGPQISIHTVTITPTVGTPVFALGASSTHCQGAATITYSATATNATGITYSLDAASIAGGNSINASTGEVTYAAGWNGTSTITASAAGCNGPRTANHTVTITASVSTPTFTLGATSTRCQGNGNVNYTAIASNTTGITYSLDAASLAGGNTINSSNGMVNYNAGWTGTTIITASAAGCNGPQTSIHTVTITPTVGTPVFASGTTSTRCQGSGTETYTATSTDNTGITYSLNAASIAGGNTINSSTGEVTYAPGYSGTSIVTAIATGCNGPRSATHTVTITPTVGLPTFAIGLTSTRCQGAGTVAYTATATNNTGITYSLDAASVAGGNSIDAATGTVTYDAGWSGTSTITASADGCNGPRTRTHTVTITPTVGTPVFILGASSTRCQGSGTVTYTATATNSTGRTYSLDPITDAVFGNFINSATGAVTFTAGWTGTSTITVTATGCNGPVTSTHTVTTTPSVTTPVFASGATSSRCQGAATVSYAATSNNTTGITYSLNAGALAGGNTIDANTGEVTYVASWTGISIITASAAGCNGPRSASHTVTTTASVATPVFSIGAASTRCQAAATVNYTALAANNTGISYSLDAVSIAGGNTINSSTGAVTYAAGWSGTSIITATASGCNGPTSSSHTATTNPTVAIPVFAMGSTSTRCQGTGTVTYASTAANSTSITYSLNGGSLAGGNTINPATGEVTYAAGFVGVSTVTASAAGCGGPRSATHTVTVTPTVGIPAFTSGISSTRCQGAGTVTYTATASNSTGITYSLDAASIAGGNTINASTGVVTYDAGWNGTSIITATANGCNGPRTSTHTVTITPIVGTPVFTIGATSTRCQGTAAVTYTATASNSTAITYSLDAASIAGGNSISSGTGIVSYTTSWSGTTIITASAAGCSGPVTSTHTVTVTPTVSTPVFTLGATSTRCEGAGTDTYTATAANSTSITYSLDAASLAGGNTINAATGAVTFVSGWLNNSTITATAAGCNGPRTSDHTVTTTPSVGVPVFTLGSVSTRLQGAGTVTYSANAANTTGITYSLDAASLAGGNTINPATGAVTYTAAWVNPAIITASAAGCNGPRTSTHTVTVNSATVTKQLYLSDPAQSLDRVDPVNTGDLTTANSPLLSTAGTSFTTFTMSPALCSDLVIKAGTIGVTNYITISSGTMPVNPAITAELRYGTTNIITLTNPLYSGGMLTWTGTLGSDVTVPAGEAISLVITTAEPGIIFRIDFDSQTKPSKIDLPVSTYIDVTSLGVYSAPYPGGSLVVSGTGGTTKYIRATVTDPFGFSDITGMNITITPTGSTVAASSVATAGCTRTYEYVWNTPGASGDYAIAAIAREGYENTVTHTRNSTYNICSSCAPVAINDIASGASGTPTVVDVLANDYDPNNNINNASLAILTGPNNGSAYISNNMIVYLPNGTFSGNDTLTYRICDNTSPSPLCATAQVVFTVDPLIIDICGDAAKTHTYYIPYPEDQSYTALAASASNALPSNNIRTVISIKIPYPGMRIVWDEWEDGYEANSLNPIQATTKVWGDGNIFNGIAPGYPTDVIPAGGGIVLDNTMNANPRNAGNIFYDGKDKVISSGQLALTQVSGEPTYMPVQAIKTNITSTYDFGQSFTIPLGQDFPSRDFRYTALFIRASQNNTTINIDKDNNGTFETTTVLNEGGSYLVNGGVLTGATVASDKPIGIELNAGGVDQYSIRNAPIFPATWYSHTYYTPVPTSDNAGDNPKDSSVVMLYNSLNRSINVNWYSGIPTSGVITIPAKSAVRFPLAYSTTAAYRFVNLTGESFTAIEIIDSYTPGGGGNDGQTYDWSFNLISEARLTDYTTVAWAPGGLDLNNNGVPDVNGNPIWVTPTANTTIYVKYDGNISGTAGLVSPCGLRYDVAYNVNALNYIKIRDASDNDQGGIALYTCNGAKIAAVYGEDPQGSGTGIGVAYWDVGSTIQPFCKEKLIIATDDYATTLVSQPVTIPVLLNDFGFLGTIDPGTVSTIGLLQPKNGTVTINAEGTVLYIPNTGFAGNDTFEYRVCSTPSPVVCDVALVIVNISTCPSNGNQNLISGQVYIDRNKDALNNDGGAGLAGIKVYLYTDGNCSGTINANELTDSVTVDSSGYYQFVKSPEKTSEDNFDDGSGGRTCNNGSDGDTPWAGNWVDANDPSAGFCNDSQTAANTDVDILNDASFGYALRLKDNDVSATRSVNLSGATKAFLSFSYRRKSATLTSGENVLVQASSNGAAFTTIYTIAGNGATDANYVTIYNQDITAYASATSAIRFLTNNSVDDADTVYIDNVSVRYLRYPQCYITSVATASIPSNYSLTTAGQRATTIASGGSCTSQFDFGLGKPNVTISGTLRNDANGLADGLVNGPAIGSPDATTIYAYLIDATGTVAFKTTVNSTNGTYSFPLAEIQTNYTLILSASNVAIGSIPPASFAGPAAWAAVGDAYGTNNNAGTGYETGTPDAAIAVNTGLVNVTNVDFGIERLPNSDNHSRSINQPNVGQVIVLNAVGMNPPILSGSDPEDCTVGCVITARSVIIDTVPSNAELYYNNALVTNGQQINNFNPGLLQLRITAATFGEVSIAFRYSFVDRAGIKDPTPATYRLVWLIPLPAEGLVASASINDDVAIVKWSTVSEHNTAYFEVERSIDNVTFAPTGEQVQASGESETPKQYQMNDKLPVQLRSDVVYYRIKLVDQDGRISYSNVVVVRVSKKPGVTVWPNPFSSYVTVSITTEREAMVDISLIDVGGKALKRISQTVPKGISQIIIKDLDQLPGGVYLVEIADKSAGTTYQKLLKNSK